MRRSDMPWTRHDTSPGRDEGELTGNGAGLASCYTRPAPDSQLCSGITSRFHQGPENGVNGRT